MGYFEQAVEGFRAIVGKVPTMAEAHANLGSALLEIGGVSNAVEAELSLRRAKSLHETIGVGLSTATSLIVNLGRAMDLQGETEAARSMWGSALRLDSTNVEANVNIALSLQRSGFLQECVPP